MLRILYTLCDLLSCFCALASPVVILHWLLKVVDSAPLRGVVRALDPLLTPTQKVLEVWVKLPPVTYAGHSFSTVPGLLAGLLAIGFFSLNFFSEMLKVTEQRWDVQAEAATQRQRLRKIQDAQQRKEKFLPENTRIFIFLDYDATLCPLMSERLDQLIEQDSARIHSRMFTETVLEFDLIDAALRFALAFSQALLGYYSTLTPADPQPSFRMALHGTDRSLNVTSATAETRRLVQFVVNNQIIVSQSTKALLDIKGSSLAYRLQSIGLYAVERGMERELYRLFPG
jgi:hypothetical protein